MSQFAINKGCDMCYKIEKGLVELTIGRTKHHLCYDCMLNLCLDLEEFRKGNYNDEEVKKVRQC